MLPVLWAFLLLTFPYALGQAVSSVQSISELYAARWALLHEPGIEVELNAWHPFGALFEPVGAGRTEALAAHQRFRAAFRKYGIQTYTVREVLRQLPSDQLISFAMNYISYNLTNATGASDDVLYYASDDYKMAVLKALPTDEVINVILSRPTIILQPSPINTAVTTLYSMVEPVGNLVFTRDQQITTPKGVVLGRLNSIQRASESSITLKCWQQLGVPVIGNVGTVPGARLEGGDFIPLGPNIVYIGVGLRSNMLAINYLLQNDLFGSTRVAVVHDYFDQSQDRMHLDTVFNVIDSKRVIMLEDIIGDASPKRRLVELYTRGVFANATTVVGNYSMISNGTEFSAFIKQEGFQIITCTNDQQLAYMVNFVNLGNGVLLSTNKDLSTQLKGTGFTGLVEYVNYSGIERMYGAAHCTSQVLRGTAPGIQPGTRTNAGARMSPLSTVASILISTVIVILHL